jgi:hypothetical protein
MLHTHRSLRHRRGRGHLWITAPLVFLAVAMVVGAMLPRRPAAQDAIAHGNASPAPYVSSDPSLPAAGTFLNLAEPLPHVEAF